MKSRSYLFLFLVIGLTAVSAVLYFINDYKLGLDIKGGVRFTLQMVNLKPEQERQLPELRRMTASILESRAGGIGVVESTVQIKEPYSFIVELPGFTDVKQARRALQTSASIKFYEANTVQSPQDTSDIRRPYDVAKESADPNDPVVFFVVKKTGEVIGPNLPDGRKNPAYKAIIDGWVEKSKARGLPNPIVEGDDLADANYASAGQGYKPVMNFSPAGSQKMRAWSQRNKNRQENIAAVLDDRVLSLASLKQGVVLSDTAEVDGVFTGEYVAKLKDLLNSGRLPAELDETSYQLVQPTIGSQALGMMLTAGLVSCGIIALFLLAYYAFPGFVALIALGLYVLFTITALKLLGATFSLAAIAGFILSVGMAVDANILVFERFKEEMKSGKTLHNAIDLGFKRALPAIIDSNACTILTSLVLANLGTGPVKGFAITLIIGVAVSLFTAVTVTRSLLRFLVDSGIGEHPSWYAVDRNWFAKLEAPGKEPLQIVNKPAKWFIISLLTIVVGLPFVFVGGFKLNVEFQGGYEVGLALKGKNLTTADIQSRLDKGGIHGANVKLAGQGNALTAEITVPPDVAQKGDTTDTVVAKVAQAAGFKSDPLDKGGDVASSGKVGETIRAETIRNAILSIIISTVLIILYLGFRFGVALGNFVAGLRFGLSAIGALLHDILVVVGVTAFVGYMYNWEISALFITSMLTVIGFSVHDTIVIFDRVRENLRRQQKGEDFASLVNRSITRSFARSINTSSTVIVTLIVLLAIGTATPDLKLFTVTMLAGIVSGTYSSIYNAAPLLYLWDRAVARARGEEHSFMGMAAAEGVRARAAQLTAPAEEARLTKDTTGRSYGTIKRRGGVDDKKRGQMDIDDDK